MLFTTPNRQLSLVLIHRVRRHLIKLNQIMSFLFLHGPVSHVTPFARSVIVLIPGVWTLLSYPYEKLFIRRD